MGTGLPTDRKQTKDGWELNWRYPDVIGAQAIGTIATLAVLMITTAKVNWASRFEQAPPLGVAAVS